MVAFALHVRAHLRGDLHQDLLRQVASCHALIELDELDDVAGDGLTLRVPQHLTVTIQLFHRVEIGVANTNDDDRARVLSQLINQVLRLRHVMDRAVSQQEQDLVHRLPLRRHQKAKELLKQRCEQSRSTQTNLAEGLAVGAHDLLDAFDVRHSHVAIHGETVADGVKPHVPWDATEAEDRELSVGIVWFNHLTNVENGAFILVVGTQIVKRVRLSWLSVRCCVVNGHGQGDLPT